jgi:transketolase
VPTLRHLPARQRREGTLRGAYVVRTETAPLETILLASGSEIEHALGAAAGSAPGTRVVSVPCFERFDRQAAAYREEVLPAACTRRVAVEAGVSGTCGGNTSAAAARSSRSTASASAHLPARSCANSA